MDGLNSERIQQLLKGIRVVVEYGTADHLRVTQEMLAGLTAALADDGVLPASVTTGLVAAFEGAELQARRLRDAGRQPEAVSETDQFTVLAGMCESPSRLSDVSGNQFTAERFERTYEALRMYDGDATAALAYLHQEGSAGHIKEDQNGFAAPTAMESETLLRAADGSSRGGWGQSESYARSVKRMNTAQARLNTSRDVAILARQASRVPTDAVDAAESYVGQLRKAVSVTPAMRRPSAPTTGQHSVARH